MIDIWLEKNKEMVDEIIKESNLKEIVNKKCEEYMHTADFDTFLTNTISQIIKDQIQEYAEYYLISDGGWNSIESKIREIIINQYLQEQKINKIRKTKTSILGTKKYGEQGGL